VHLVEEFEKTKTLICTAGKTSIKQRVFLPSLKPPGAFLRCQLTALSFLVELGGGEDIVQDPVFGVEEEHCLLSTPVRFLALMVEGTPCSWGLAFSSLVSSHESTRLVCETNDQ
jgi:hypothetical protein